MDFDLEGLQKDLDGRVIGCRICYREVVGSTMEEARKLAEDGRPEGAIIVAEEQTAGRGRFKRQWVSPPGQNLSFSIVLRSSSTQMPYVNMAASLAVAMTVEEFCRLKPCIKWPNDVRVNGRKIAGILIESAIERGEPAHVIVGIGLNVNLDPAASREIASTATSLRREMGRPVDRTAVMKVLLRRFDCLYADVKQGRSLKDQWAASLETLGRTVRVRMQDRVMEGYASHVDERGNLVLVRQDGSLLTAVAGEVTLQV